MSQISDVMTRGVRTMSPSDTLQFAAQAMDELNVGALPVCDEEKLIGIVTDRDITVRGVAQGMPDSTPVSEVMSEGVRTCFEDQTLDDVTEQMRGAQIRRMLVLSRDRKIVGIVSLGDVAVKGPRAHAADVLANISEPAEPDRSAQPAQRPLANRGSTSGGAHRMTG